MRGLSNEDEEINPQASADQEAYQKECEAVGNFLLLGRRIGARQIDDLRDDLGRHLLDRLAKPHGRLSRASPRSQSMQAPGTTRLACGAPPIVHGRGFRCHKPVPGVTPI